MPTAAQFIDAEAEPGTWSLPGPMYYHTTSVHTPGTLSLVTSGCLLDYTFIHLVKSVPQN